MGGIHIADALEIPYFRAFTMTWTKTRAYPHAFGVPDRKVRAFKFWGRSTCIDRCLSYATDGRELQLSRKGFIRSYVTPLTHLLQSYVLFDQVFWRGIASQVNRWRRSSLGLPSTSLDKMDPHKVPFLYNFSSVLVPTPLDWPEWIRVTGPPSSHLINCPLTFPLSARLLVFRRCRCQRQEMDSAPGTTEVYRGRAGGKQEDCVHWLRIYRRL